MSHSKSPGHFRHDLERSFDMTEKNEDIVFARPARFFVREINIWIERGFGDTAILFNNTIKTARLLVTSEVTGDNLAAHEITHETQLRPKAGCGRSWVYSLDENGIGNPRDFAIRFTNPIDAALFNSTFESVRKQIAVSSPLYGDLSGEDIVPSYHATHASTRSGMTGPWHDQSNSTSQGRPPTMISNLDAEQKMTQVNEWRVDVDSCTALPTAMSQHTQHAIQTIHQSPIAEKYSSRETLDTGLQKVAYIDKFEQDFLQKSGKHMEVGPKIHVEAEQYVEPMASEGITAMAVLWETPFHSRDVPRSSAVHVPLTDDVKDESNHIDRHRAVAPELLDNRRPDCTKEETYPDAAEEFPQSQARRERGTSRQRKSDGHRNKAPEANSLSITMIQGLGLSAAITALLIWAFLPRRWPD